MTELQNLNLASFAEHLQTKFQAYVDEEKTVEFELVSATDTGTRGNDEQFAVVFRGPLETFLTQGTYKLEHPRMGTFDLFLVPIKRDEQGFYYEACFSRMN